MTGRSDLPQKFQLSIVVDGVTVRGTIVDLHPRHIRVGIDEPYEGLITELNINLLVCPRPPERVFAHNDALTEYGADTARRLLAELFERSRWFFERAESLREPYLRFRRRLESMERLGMPEAKMRRLRRGLRARLRRGELTPGEYQRSLFGLKQARKIHGFACHLLADSFWQEAGPPGRRWDDEKMLRHVLGLELDSH